MLLFRLPYGAGNRKSPWVTYAFLLISWSAGFQETDKTQLNDAIAKAPKDADKDTVYWHADDRWNGEIASKVGFWNEMLSALSKARTVSEDKFASEDAVKEATDNLSNAVANLIKAENNNTTLLYEELLNEPNKADYTPKSWSAYTKVRDRAEAMMSTMFDEEGKPTSANTSAGGKQKELETLAAELTTAREALDKRAALVNPDAAKNAELLIDAIEELQTRYADADLSDYTAPSVRKLQEELASADALTKVVTAYSSIGSKELTSLQTALRNLRMAALGLETEQTGQIHVELSVLDAADISNKKVGDSQALRNPNTRTATLELPANASAYDLLHAKLETGGTYYTQSNTDSVALVFLNGELLYNPSFGHDYYDVEATLESVKLHDGDKLSLIWFKPNMILRSSTNGSDPQPMQEIMDWFRYSTIQVEQEVTAGVPFTVTVTSESAFPFLKDGGKPFAGAEIYYGAAKETPEDAATTYVHRQTNTLTDENGQAQITLYEEGYVLLNAFRQDNEGRYTVGPSVLVHVNATTDPTAAKLRLREQLDEVYYDENYPESAFTAERWAARKKAYEDGVQGIANAETLAEASTAQSEAIAAIKKLQSDMDETNVNNPWNFRYQLSTLPDEVTKLDAAAQTTINTLADLYEKIKATPYQLAELTEQEIQKYEAVVAASKAGLPPAKEHTLTFEQKLITDDPDDQEALEAMIAYLQANTPTDDKYGESTGNKKLLPLFGFSKYRLPIEKATALTKDLRATLSPDYTAYLLCRNAARAEGKDNGPGVISAEDGSWSISDATLGSSFQESGNTVTLTGSMTYTINDKQYAIRDISIEGAEVPLSLTDSNVLKYEDGRLIDASTYKGKTDVHINVHAKNAQIGFIMPFNDVKITVTWGPVGGTESEAEKARSEALRLLATLLAKYDETSATYEDVKKAYNEGVAKIADADQTPTVDAINAVRRSTADAMAKAAAGSTGTDDKFKELWGDPENNDGFYAGDPRGTVTVIVEDTTYPGLAEFYSDPDAPNYNIKTDAFLYRENYTIGSEDTMMTVILRALAEKGCTWTGTGGSGFGISYLSGITYNNQTLKEFTGGNESGWMGTLNGFFVNLSFSEFRVTKQEGQESNILLADGDVIHVMYTCTGLGEDLGGTWYNSDTTLKALKVMDGDKALELAPEFESVVAKPGGTYSYTVMIDGDAAELTITTDAANKNYLVKRFLNEKVTDNTEGGSYYKSTQAIPVVSGDTIYIGCGEPVWPSMNNQGAEAREYVGTWYELHIVSANSGGSDVDAQIDALPNPNDLTYTNRETYRQDIVQAKQALDALKDPSSVSADRKQKLEALCEKLAGFDAVDEVKAAIAALPSVSNATLDDETAINAAKTKYDALDADMLTYLKASEKQKLSDLLQRMEELNEELLTKLVVAPDTVTAVVDAKTKTIQLVGYITEGQDVTLNGETVKRSGTKFTLGNTVYRVVLNVTVQPVNVTLDEKRPEITPAEDASPETKAATAAITSPSTTSDGLAAAAADHLTETAKKQAEASGNADASVTAEVKLNISVEKYEEVGGKQELTLDITPQVTYTVTADGQTLSTKTETLDNSAIKAPVTISVALPLDMPQENLYVKHKLEDGSFEYIKPTIERNVATWQQSSFSIVVLTADSRTATVKMNDLDVTLTPEDVGKELPTVTKPGKDFTGWTFVIDGTEYPGGPYTKLTDDLLTKLSGANEVTATPNFKNKASSGSGSSGKIESPNKPNKSTMGEADASKFRDVSSSDWYFDAVQYVLEKGLMNGTSDWTFAPNDATTRGMIVTILARVEGVNTTGNPWYAAGQKWAMQNDISDGTNMPGVITREQLATILYRYAKQKGYDVSKSAALTGFSDADKVSGYAFDAMQWAVAEELLKGSNGKLDPQGSATRAQVATILMRFMQKYEK